MPQSAAVESTISLALTWLEKQQDPDGSFVSYSSAAMQPFRRVRSWQTTFVPALMLASLANLDTPKAMTIRQRLAGFLLAQKDNNWTFNYWANEAPERQTMPYPNDLDDTFCALIGLYLQDPSIIDEAVLAKAIKVLLATEVSVGGPYRTWLVPQDSPAVWLDVDLAVNSNIAYFLSLVGKGLPKLNKLMEEAITNDTYASPYYPSVYTFVYYFARAYNGPYKDRLLQKARRLHKAATTDLNLALCLSARLRLNETQDLTGIVNKLMAGQRRDGSWAAAAFYADPVKNGKLYYNGSAALTTAFVLEALQLFTKSLPLQPILRQPTDLHRINRKTTLKLARQQCQSLSPELRSTTMRLLKKMADSPNGPEIISLPPRFNQSLLEPLHPPSEDFLNNLCLANLYGWLAYTIHDDFLDSASQPSRLPVANLAMRSSVHYFEKALPANESYGQLVRQTFNTIDGANAWELKLGRFKVEHGSIIIKTLPDYGNLSKLADRSLGHTLAPLAILAAKGISPSSRPFQQVQKALFHYLILRQLNDDVHDWQIDLENGHISYVVTKLLKDLSVRPGKHNLSALLTRVNRQFWYGTLPILCEVMQAQAEFSRQALVASNLFTDDNVITELVNKLEGAASEAATSQRQATNFLKHYTK